MDSNTLGGFVRKFGLDLAKSKDENKEKINKTTIIPQEEDGGVVFDSDISGRESDFLFYGRMFDAEIRNSKEKINFYRRMTLNPYVDEAIDNIINEAVNIDEENEIINISIDKTDFSDRIKERITEEFNEIVKMLRFDFNGHQLFNDFYVDGQLYINIIVDPDDISEGIQDLRIIDPRTVQKFVQIIRDESGVEIDKKEYFMYFPQALDEYGNTNAGTSETRINRQRFINKRLRDQIIILNPDSVAYIWSGKRDMNGTPISYLEYAIKSYNQLNSLEDAILVYRLSRAPEKRAFYIDVGDLSRTKAEQYIKSMIDKYKNKASYNVQTGQLENNAQITSMFHDYWIPRKDGKTTDIQTVGGTNSQFADPSEIDYFLKKLYRSLKIPLTRLSVESTAPFSKGSEITRDELKFQKFIDKLRIRFSELFSQILRIQLLVKKVITQEEWEENQYYIRYNFVQDSMLYEIKSAELLDMKLESLGSIIEYVGKKDDKNGFFSKEWVLKKILGRSEEEIKEIEKQQEEEEKRGIYGSETDDGFGGDEPPEPPANSEPSEPSQAPTDDEVDATTPNNYDTGNED